MTTVAETLDAFLSERTYRRCDDDPDAFANLFGPDKIPGQLGEFLGWYMVRKVMAGQELLKAAGTVTKKLSAWLEANGHISETDAAVMADRAADAVVELPAAGKLGDLLHDQIHLLPRFDPDDIPDEHWLEDMFVIDRVEPGKLWFHGVPGDHRASAASASSISINPADARHNSSCAASPL